GAAPALLFDQRGQSRALEPTHGRDADAEALGDVIARERCHSQLVIAPLLRRTRDTSGFGIRMDSKAASRSKLDVTFSLRGQVSGACEESSDCARSTQDVECGCRGVSRDGGHERGAASTAVGDEPAPEVHALAGAADRAPRAAWEGEVEEDDRVG